MSCDIRDRRHQKRKDAIVGQPKGTSMTHKIKIPHDVAEKLAEVENAMRATVTRMERLHAIYGDGESDCQLDDGSIDEWQVSFDHSEIERLMANLRFVQDFAGWLAKFEKEAAE